MATEVKNIKESLKNGIVTFKFFKKDGSIRTAKGTTKLSTIEEMYYFKGGEGPSRFGYISYWDMDKKDWRCFDESKLIEIVSVE